MNATVMEKPAAISCDPRTRVTKSLLGYGVLAGAVYVVTAAVQAATRSGFDPTRHDISLLANGGLGWIQITNFALSGLMVLAAAIGMRRALSGERGGKWGPLLVGGYGIGLIAAGVFTADPAFGFPAGAPDRPTTISWHGTAHMFAGAIGFLALIAACGVFARRFAKEGRRGWAVYSAVTGVLFLAGFAGIASGSGDVATTLAFTAAVLIAWSWLAALSVHLYSYAGVKGATEAEAK
ncbi:DUF998 domain-containing protein [Amycolatopsis taiwanensis]|uniref:DUF998 domain-containing protein n=1 Tax=Amycolatopsis taiwanensis TaxID=342230 RepID=A0A9W6QYV0_9PSEU|nr:DUF998 domain-containing protein [Amycolatopsis taiwanensis]GLY65083.1 hypothetical protein Atai01_17020 [Amycolatopsis taiwanensis]